METKRICPSCQKPLPPDVPLGLCPECLIKSGFNTGTDPGNPGKESGFVPPPVEELRKLFPQLEILELIGKGGMGAVYKARQLALDRLVALKILPPGAADDAGFAERFNREARALARLNHPHIVAVHDFGQTGGQPYLVMEFVDGPNLRQVEQAGRLTPVQALEIVPQICEALQFAHNEGIVHRDIKPENILLDKKGRVKITDFGIAKIVGVPAGKISLTGAKDVLGTPHYMAPEQVEKPATVDHRADIYSLGVVFYELLTGELPLGKFQPPSKKVQMDVRLDEVVLHTLEKEPERRYQHVSEVKSDVETIATTPPPVAAASPQRTKINWIPALVFYALLTMLEVMLLEADLKYPGLSDAFLPVIVVLAICITGVVLWGVLHYRCWQALPERVRATTPGKAVGLFFIPIYNFYWGFITFPKLADGFNALRAEHPHLPLVNMKKLGLAYAVALIAGFTLFWVPFLGSCASVVNLILFILFYRGIVHNANLWIGQNPPKDVPITNENDLAKARQEVKNPANWLVATGILNWIAIPLVVFVTFGIAAGKGMLFAAPTLLIPLSAMLLSSLIIVAGLKMKQLEAYPLAIIGSILAILVTPGNLIGLPVGIWALVVLCRREVREAFGKGYPPLSAEAPPPARGSGAWKVAAVIVAAILLLLAIPIGAILLSIGVPAYMKARQRARIVQGEVISEVPITPPMSVSFSPVREVILNDLDESRGNEALSFASGQLLSFAPDFGQQSTEARALWLDKNHIDLLVDYARGQWALVSRGLQFRDLHNAAWDAPQIGFGGQWPDTEVLEKRETREGTLYLLPTNVQPPLTFTFRTANGDHGALQITGWFTNEPRGMKLRYKLAQLAGGGGGGRATASSPDLRDSDAEAIKLNVPNRYLAAALVGMDLAAERIKDAAALGRLSEQADVFNHFNELCDQLQGKNQNAAFTPQDWGIQDADKFKIITDRVAALEDASERMRDMARSTRHAEAEREAFLKAEANKFVSRYADFKAQLHLATQSGGMGAAGQNAQRKFVRLVVDKTALTFEGQPTSWDSVGALLAKVPDRKNTVLEFAVTSDRITVAQQNEWFQKASALARQHGFEYASFIGIHPFGSKGTSSSSAESVPPFAQAKPGEYRVELPNGVTVEVVALTSTPRAGLAWWQPDGTLLREPPGDRLGEVSGFCPGGKSSVEFAVLVKETETTSPERVLLFEPLPQYVDTTELFKGNQSAGAAAVIGYRATPEKLTCKIGVANGPEERVATWDGAGALLSNDTGGPLQLVRSGADGESCFKLAHRVDPARFNVRIAARLKNGEHKLARVWRVEYGGAREARLCALIRDLQDSDVVAYELYRVPLRWTIIPGIVTKPTVAPVRAKAEAFGPVTERLVAGEGDARRRCIDFDTGRQFAASEFFGPKAEPSPEETQKWWQENSIDAMGDTSPAVLGLVGLDMIAVPVPLHEWDMPPARLEYYLAAAKPGTPATMSAKGDLPATFVIQTREGGRGVLQITGFSGTAPNTRSVTIRYKLLNPANAAGGPQSGLGQTTPPAVAPTANLIASENWAEIMRLFPQAIRRTDKANAVEGDIRIGIPILLEWDMSLPMAFVTGMEKRPMPEFKPGCWLEFPPERDRVIVHLRHDPWPHAAWRFHLAILDDGGTAIQQLDHTLENTGRRPPKRQWTVEQSEFSGALGHGVLDRGKRFRMSVESLWTEQDGEFQPGVELPLYFGLSTVDYTGMFRAEGLKVDATNAEAVVRARVAEWPKAKWNLALELFDSDGHPTGEGEGVAENGGWIVSRVATGEREFRLPVKNLGSGTRAPQRFRLRVEAISDPPTRSAAGARASSASAVVSPTNPPALSFGPVLERQLRTGLIEQEDRVLDLEDGRVLSLPANLPLNGMNNPRPLLNWMVKERADLMLADAGTHLNLHLDDGRLVRLPDDATFEGIAALEVESRVAGAGASQNLSVPKVPPGPRGVFAFKTREGGMGVLQFTGLSGSVTNTRSAMIRYKLVRSTNENGGGLVQRP